MDITELLRSAPQHRARVLSERERQANGHFWTEDGKAWSGSVPVGGFSSRTEALSAIKQDFAPVDVVSDIIGYHCDAIDGTWYVSLTRPLAKDEAPIDEEQALIDRAEALLTSWWDEHDAPALFRTALEPLTWANVKEAGKRPLTVAPLRLLIPEASTVRRDDGVRVVLAGEPEEAVLKVHLEAPSPLNAGALRDENGLTVGYYYTYALEGQTYTELCALGKHLYPDLPQYAEQAFLEVRRGEELVGRAVYDLGGLLLHDERTATRLLITDSVLSEQRQLNTANTLKGINLRDHGFVQEDLFNIDIPGVWQDASGQPISEKQAAVTPGAKFVANKIEKGPNISRAWEGTPILDEQGFEKGRVTPNVVRHQPSSSDEFRKDIDHSLDVLYFLARQAHRRISGDAVASGEARIQALKDFQLSLEPTKRQYENAVQWALTALLRLSAVLCGRTGLFDRVRVVCNAKNAAVQPTPEGTRVYNEMREKNQIDTETHLELTGVTNDVDATVQRMKSEGILEGNAATRATILMALADKSHITPQELRAELIDLGILPQRLAPTTSPEVT